ncbi:MAG: heavy-metal-associated domain-containing protein [Lentisphaerae bacterium]|nr:heavy-metal-associated domain-containing protein [Lentisphaerota bacterium]
MKWSYIFLLLALLTMVSCRKQDVRMARITVPQMNSQDCADRVSMILQRIPGVLGDQVAIDRERRDVAVPYDSLKLSLKNIEYTLAKAGFEANNIPADEKARAALPESWR